MELSETLNLIESSSLELTPQIYAQISSILRSLEAFHHADQMRNGEPEGILLHHKLHLKMSHIFPFSRGERGRGRGR